MRRAAVICEFNPFHNGHKFLLEKIKTEYADEIICIMSGSFVQRGDIAITDKYTRTKTALENGADMVVELPTVYAVAPAQVFGESGVRLASELGCDLLCFGAENSSDELKEALSVLDRADIQQKIAALMSGGSYYPKALSEAVGAPYDDIISKPNNILALEYIRACQQCGIEPIAIERKGVDHDEAHPVGNVASASYIRELIQQGEPYHDYTPIKVESPAFLNAIEPAILYRLKTMSRNELALLPDVSEGLENRIADAASQYNSLSEILEAIKTKRYTMARLRRILICATLGITREIQSEPLPYIRVLGVKAEKKHLISAKSLPLIVDVKSGYDRLDNSIIELFNIDIKATELMNIAQRSDPQNEFSYGLIIRKSS